MNVTESLLSDETIHHCSFEINTTNVNQTTCKAITESFKELGCSIKEDEGLWDWLSTGRINRIPQNLIVFSTLAHLAKGVTQIQPNIISTFVQQSQPLIMAYVSNAADREKAHRIDELMRMFNNRLWVYEIKKPLKRYIWNSLHEALTITRPESIIETRFFPQEDLAWVRFGDGQDIHIHLSQLDLPSAWDIKKLQAVKVGEHSSCIEFINTQGKVFDIDSEYLRALSDEVYAIELIDNAETVHSILGERLKAKRKAIGLSQAELMKRSGMEQARISNLERGKHQPRLETLRKYAKGLGLSLTDLLQ